MDMKKIEAKWQEKWEKDKLYSFNKKRTDKKFYCLEMFSYPSASKLHLGHGAWVHGAAGDICAREIGQYGMLPSDMLNVLPRLLK